VNLATGRVTPLAVDPATWLRLRKQAEKERAYLNRKPRSPRDGQQTDGAPPRVPLKPNKENYVH
jgi:hypothetical protein